jgi:hypothetical protein
MKIVERAGETILAHSHCPNCDGAVLSLLYRDMLGITLVGLVTDLNYQDAVRIKDEQLIDEDDVLKIYEKLN